MKKLIFLILFLSLNISSQDLKKVDLIIYSYHSITSAEQLAKRIDYDFNTDIEKIRALYTWLTLNIQYDYSVSTNIKSPEIIIHNGEIDLKYRLRWIENNLVSKTISTKKSVCYGIAITFKKVCDLLNLESELIKGYTRTLNNEINYIPKNKNHIWNAVKINEKWVIVDATYGLKRNAKNSKPNYYYFDIEKEKLNLTHFTSNPKWINYLNQKKLKNFCYQPIFSDAYFKYNVELIEPLKGKITSEREKIILKIRNIKPETEISYKFEESLYRQIPTVKSKNYTTNIVIDNPKKNTNLYIYLDGEYALSYKITKPE
ncbi:transglutaminase domain-containing protein [Polaribacter sp. Hel1_85]|uniref:transglutaminase domain-containing protein n=1 Tax=Polaribacter sp. Hel1_85 TaxID=1250005 RepID=UPI00052D9FF0|nr:transglutaminase domain-containing protein [Polaribacter sp. Hel1_85]KGL62801.1 transglutaminase domain protein-containing protein [Polaribacter sp. Hel1_85]